MAQTAVRLRLVEAASTGYARKAWISHVIETAPDEVGGVELALLKELADLVDDATGWVEASYDKLAKRTRFALKTVRRAVKVLAAAGLVEPELIRGQGRDRLRYHFPAMHAYLAERKARRDGGRTDHGHSDHGQRWPRMVVPQSQNPPPLKELDSEPSARAPAREGLNLDRVLERLGGRVPKLLVDAVRASAPELHGQTLVLWMPERLEAMLRGEEAKLQAVAGIGVDLKRASQHRPDAQPAARVTE